MPQDWAKLLTCRSGKHGKMPEILALAGCLPIMLGRQGMNPRKSTLADLVCKRNASGFPVQPCGDLKMSNDDAGNLIMQCTWYFLPLAAWGFRVVYYSNRCSLLLTAFCCILVHFNAYNKISLHSILMHF